MNVQLRVLAHAVRLAGHRLESEISSLYAYTPRDQDTVKRTDQQITDIVSDLDDLSRDTAKQLEDRDTLSEFESVTNDVDQWMTGHDRETFRWEVFYRGDGIVKLVLHGGVSPGKSSGTWRLSDQSLIYEGVSAHLDAAISAAESMMSGNRNHEERVVIHAKEISDLLVNQSDIPKDVKQRIGRLIVLTDQVIDLDPYVKERFDEVIDPLRKLK